MERLATYRAEVRRTFQQFSDQALAFQDARIVGGIDREECDREIERRRKRDPFAAIVESGYSPSDDERDFEEERWQRENARREAEEERDAEPVQRMETIPCSTLPAIGTRVRLLHDVDRYPHFIADEGMEGSVVHTPSGDPSGTFCVLMDEHLEGAEEWDNEIVWSVGDGDDPMRDLEVIS